MHQKHASPRVPRPRNTIGYLVDTPIRFRTLLVLLQTITACARRSRLPWPLTPAVSVNAQVTQRLSVTQLPVCYVCYFVPAVSVNAQVTQRLSVTQLPVCYVCYFVCYQSKQRTHTERDNRDTLLFAEFPTAQYLNRIWGTIAPHLDLTADEIFSEVARVAASLPPATSTDLISTTGDWSDVAGSVDDHDWEELGRWVDCISRGDAFDAVPGKDSGLIAADIFYYTGPYMLNEHRADGTHFQLAASTMGKLFQSDGDEKLCDGSQLASEVAEGMRDSTWPALFTHIPPGNDMVLDIASSTGGQRIADLRNQPRWLLGGAHLDRQIVDQVCATQPAFYHQAGKDGPSTRWVVRRRKN